MAFWRRLFTNPGATIGLIVILVYAFARALCPGDRAL